MNIMSTASYFARVSTPQQNLDNQKKIIENYCERKNLIINESLSVQGTGYQNKYVRDLEKYRKILIKNKPSHLVVHSADRLARNLVAFTKFISSLSKAMKIHFIVERKIIKVADFFPATVEACEIFSSVNNAQLLSATQGDKIRRTLRIIKEANPNAYTGGVVPFGFKLIDKENHRELREIKEIKRINSLMNWLVDIKKVPKLNLDTVLNKKSVYCPFYLNGDIQYLCWTPKLVKKVYKKQAVVSKNINIAYRDLNFNMLDMELLLEDDGNYQYKKILDRKIIFRTPYVKVEWRANKAGDEQNISWIPESWIN